MQIPLLKTYPVLIVSCNKRYLVLQIFVSFFLLFFMLLRLDILKMYTCCWNQPGCCEMPLSILLRRYFFFRFSKVSVKTCVRFDKVREKKGNILVCVRVLRVSPANMMALILFRHQKTKDASPSSSS